MIELHGWIKICAAYKDEDRHTETQEDKVIYEVEKYIQNLQYKTIKKIDTKNGNYFISISLFTNHKNVEVNEIIDAFTNISKIAKGSYGLLYLWDDEDEQNDNNFMTLIIRRGNAEWKVDRLLSPLIPMVYDDYL